MKEIRAIHKIITGKNAIDGAGVKLIREIGNNDTRDFDPFLLLDAFDSLNPADYVRGFPWHPHRGIETITYLIEGCIEHGDSMSNKGVINAGDCQWMTAGSGIIHQEMPKPTDRLLGVQLWLNLPAKDKMTRPKYRAIVKQDIPVIDEKGKRIHILCGSYGGHKGAMEADYVKAHYLDVEMDAGSEWTLQTDPEHTLFIYILQGEALFGDEAGKAVSAKQVILFAEGNTFRAKTQDQSVRFLLMSGKSLKEPIAWAGPIVMNTQKELSLAFEELESTTFIKNLPDPI